MRSPLPGCSGGGGSRCCQTVDSSPAAGASCIVMARPRSTGAASTAERRADSGRDDEKLIQGKARSEGGSARTSLLILVSIFLSAAFVMFLVYRHFPQLSEEESEKLRIPRDMEDAKALGKVLSKYKDTFYVECSGLGASFCYLLSYLVGRPVVYKYLTEKAVKWSQQVERHRDHLINYIIFLRITPFLPNWFINITAPVINVPLKVFFLGTFLGVAPPSFVAIKAGTTLYQLTTAGEAVSWNSVIVLMVLAVVSILPAIFQNKLKKKFE
ncbi:transmembrane protein 41B isoform 2-T2 [Anomaloglossus baeobatrachus]|uniref:transmembrane protein 41B isoform X2 n=1 Tax=Anomaloglossus baeobatrachus TaxID=238106 RepID=UPI003F5070F1